MDMVQFANDLMSSALRPDNYTHAGELMNELTRGRALKEAHFLADGIRAVLPHHDGHDYEIIVRPVKKILPCPLAIANNKGREGRV